MKEETKFRIDSVAESRNVTNAEVENSLESEMRELMDEVLNNDN